MSSPFPPEFLDEMKELLLAKRKQLTTKIQKELEEMRASGQGHHLADMDDLSGDANDEEMSFRLLEMGGKELEQINRALGRIQDGKYGLCEDTDQPIGQERLRVLPFATLSIEAQRKREREEHGR